MANPKLRLLNMLQQKQPAIGTFMALQGMRAAQVIARTGMDAVIVDQEHGHIADADIHAMVSAIASSNVSPIVRIPAPTMPLIKRALDTGAHGVLVPQINNAEDAKSVVQYAKFPPWGIRGQGSAFTAWETGFKDPSEYVQEANGVILTIVQIETKEGLKNVDEICAVEGIDMVFIGPNDLALAVLGYTPAKYTETVFLDAINHINATAKRHGKKTGILVATGEIAKERLKEFDFVAMGTEIRALQAFYGKELAIARS